MVKVLPLLYCGLGTSPLLLPLPSPAFSTHVHWAGVGFREVVTSCRGSVGREAKAV